MLGKHVVALASALDDEHRPVLNVLSRELASDALFISQDVLELLLLRLQTMEMGKTSTLGCEK